MKTVSFIRMNALGDCLLTTGIIKKYKQENPSHRIVVATDNYEPFARLEEVEYIFEDKQKAIVNSNSFYDLDLCYERTPEKHILSAYGDYVFGKGNYNIDEIKPILTSNNEDRNSLYDIMTQINFPMYSKYVVIHAVGENNPRSCLPHKTWEDVIQKLVDKGYFIALIGTDKDQQFTLSDRVYDFKGLTDIWHTRALIDEAQAFIGMDSGPSHIAQTTQTPCSIIYNVADPTLRIHRPEKTRIVTSGLSCEFCLKKTPPPVTFVNCKNIKCLEVITSETILGY